MKFLVVVRDYRADYAPSAHVRAYPMVSLTRAWRICNRVVRRAKTRFPAAAISRDNWGVTAQRGDIQRSVTIYPATGVYR